VVLFDGEYEQKKPYSRTLMDTMKRISEQFNCQFMVQTPLGPVPMELDTMYPVGQSVLPEVKDLPEIEKKRVISLMERYSHNTQDFMGLVWDGEQTLESMQMMADKGPVPYRYDLLKVVAVCDYQFGRDAAAAIFGSYDLADLEKRVEFVKSKNTGMIRNVIVDGEHVLSLRARDGYFTLKLPGAKKLIQAFPSPKLRVVVDGDSFPFNKEGKNVFAPFVLDADEDIRPGDDVIIVNEKDELAGVGRALMNKEEMLAFKSGIAVRTKSGDKDEEQGD
jgi:7-cyano-7-deazaguanine tRNA-ribosyltransferase